MTIKKTPFLKELQEYLQLGTRSIKKLEEGLIKSEQHIKDLERKDPAQALIKAQEQIKTLKERLSELEADPHAALNKSEKQIEVILHKIVEAEKYLLGTYIKVLANLEAGSEAGTTEQKNAYIKYKERLGNAKKYLTTQQAEYKEGSMPSKTKKDNKNTPGNEILGENYFD